MATAIHTLRQAAHHGMVLRVECQGCQHTAHFLAADVVRFVSPGRSLAEVPFRCHECKGVECRVVPMELDRDRTPDIIVWRPMRLR